MKRCPKCNRTYATDTQKFCTQDGGLLVDTFVGRAGAGQGETIRISSAQLDSAQLDDEPTKAISRELVSESPFDPFKTVIASRPGETKSATRRDTQDLSPLSSTQHSMADQSPPQPPGSGQISQPPISAPLQPASGSLPSTGSGPIDLSATIAPSMPTMHLSGSGPIAAPLPSHQFAAPPPGQQSQPATAPRPTKKSRAPLVLGILAVLFVFGLGVLGAAYFFVVKPMLAKRVVVVDSPRPPKEPTPNVESTPNVEKADKNVVMIAPRRAATAQHEHASAGRVSRAALGADRGARARFVCGGEAGTADGADFGGALGTGGRSRCSVQMTVVPRFREAVESREQRAESREQREIAR